jgi:hypothetical protein
MNVPQELEYMTADEVAECISYQKYMSKTESDELYRKLWQFLEEANNPTPLGGDGSNGTVEEPAERLDLDNDDKTSHWWSKLNHNEQEALTLAIRDLACYD